MSKQIEKHHYHERKTFMLDTERIDIDKDKEISRLSDEISEQLKFEKPSIGLKAMFNDGRLEKILPELSECFSCRQNNPHHCFNNVGDHILSSVDYAKNGTDKTAILYATLLHDIGKPETLTTDEHGIDHYFKHANLSAEKADKALDKLNIKNEEKDEALFLIKYHDIRLDNPKAVQKWINKYGEEYMRDLCVIKRADVNAQDREYMFTEKMKQVSDLEEIIDKITSKSS